MRYVLFLVLSLTIILVGVLNDWPVLSVIGIVTGSMTIAVGEMRREDRRRERQNQR